MSDGATVLADVRDKVGESPVWSVAEQALYWVDIEGRQIRRHDWSTGQTRSVATPERVGCISLRRGGGLIAAMETGVFATDWAGTTEAVFTPIATVRHPASGMRFNDGRCDPAGRFWIGTMVMDMSAVAAEGELYCLASSDLSGHDSAAPMPAPILRQIIVPNGLAFSPDGRRMYLSDSHPAVQAIWCFDFDVATGAATDRRLFVDMREHPGRPDGAAVDQDGCYWTCANDAGFVHRFTPAGRLDRSIALPVSKPAMCAFAGPHLDVLVVTSIQPAKPGAAHPDDATLSGHVLVVNPGTRGLSEPSFAMPPG